MNDIDNLIEKIVRRKDLRDVVHHETIAARPPSFSDTKRPLLGQLKQALASLGITRLYSHQAAGIDLIREGRHTVVMTPTASGKSLIYNVPVIESLLEDPLARALYIFPLKGLEQDQLKAFRELAGLLPGAEDKRRAGGRRAFTPGMAEIYDGDTTAYRRKKIREAPPPVVLTNPDMLHLAINAFHTKWEEFFKNLKYVVIDEVHTYRGVFGSHVAHVIRRLRRIASRYGADPIFIACSATIANPKELSESLTGLPFEAVTESGAPQGKRNFLFINPSDGASPYTIATKLLTQSVSSGFKTIAFTRARKITELMHAWIKQGHPDIAPAISSYRAGFLPEERREIERRLFSGELSGVVSTSALELGVDIGGLDVCVLVGYPGTVSSTWQRSGRVGRSGRDSLIVMVALADALDQYFMRHPTDFFRRSVEAAVLDEENPDILKSHLLCACAEGLLKKDDAVYDTARHAGILRELESEGLVRFWEKGGIWYPRKKNPHKDVSIRETGQSYAIRKADGAMLGESSSARVMRELHPGAVYLHKGSQYKCVRLDITNRIAICEQADSIDYYTRALTSETTEIISVEAARRLPGGLVETGLLRVTEEVTGYLKKRIQTEETVGEHALNLPPSVFKTAGIWMKVGPDIIGEIEGSGLSVDGSLHAAEHAAIAALPLYALCDRMDLGGVSYSFNPELKSPAIFIYDGHEGGVGLTRRGFECIEGWFLSAVRMMEECQCEIACPSCTQDPKCGNNNEPLDKRGAAIILRRLLGKNR